MYDTGTQLFRQPEVPQTSRSETILSSVGAATCGGGGAPVPACSFFVAFKAAIVSQVCKERSCMRAYIHTDRYVFRDK